ncbi:hypothetical protein P8X24_03105 [Pyrococcus kukulkanii]|uniref:hypothetical protein n=1 Tax=Pyrococcus kukulkanii TaxID=1609559 RepID=UPI003561C8F8
MKHVSLEISSSTGIIALIILAPSLLLYLSWTAFIDLNLSGIGGAKLLKTVPLADVEETLAQFETSLAPFIQDVSTEQMKAFNRGIRTSLIGAFLVTSVLTALTFGKALSTGTIIYDIGLVRNKKKVFFHRIAPLILYSLFLASILTIGLAAIFPLTGVKALKSDLVILLLVMILSSLWGVFLSATLSAISKEYAYSILMSFLVAGIFLTLENVGDLVFPFFRLLVWLSTSGQIPLGKWGLIGTTLFAVSPALSLKAFERGDYY